MLSTYANMLPTYPYATCWLNIVSTLANTVFGRVADMSANMAATCRANTHVSVNSTIFSTFKNLTFPAKAALACRMANLRGMRASTLLSTVCHLPTWTTRILDWDVSIAVQWGATYNCLMAKGYTVDRVSLHSLRAGGAMAMKLSSATDSMIMRIGRWTSLTSLTYIHSQIGALSAGVAWRMSQQFTFQNIG